MVISEFIAKLEKLKEAHGDIPVVASGRLLRARPGSSVRRVDSAGQAAVCDGDHSLRGGALMRHGALLVCLHAVVWAFVLWATSDGDCTKSADCSRGHYCKAGTCVPKEGK